MFVCKWCSLPERLPESVNNAAAGTLFPGTDGQQTEPLWLLTWPSRRAAARHPRSASGFESCHGGCSQPLTRLSISLKPELLAHHQFKRGAPGLGRDPRPRASHGEAASLRAKQDPSSEAQGAGGRQGTGGAGAGSHRRWAGAGLQGRCQAAGACPGTPAGASGTLWGTRAFMSCTQRCPEASFRVLK